MRRGSKYEVSTKAFDPRFQTLGAGPDKSGEFVGVPVPSFAGAGVDGRYLFMLANARFGAHRRAHLVGIRTLVTILAQVSDGVSPPGTRTYFLERMIRNPTWSFQDGNVSFHLRQVSNVPNIPTNVLNRAGSAQGYAQTPALLYNTINYAGTYSPPAIQGDPLIPELGTWHDLRFPWESSQGWDSVDIQVDGPCDVALYASVKQTNPATRTTLTLPAFPNVQMEALEDSEDLFVFAFPQAQYGRVAGSLIFEEEEINTQEPPPPRM